jgi:uncharacterized membrane protein YcfT
MSSNSGIHAERVDWVDYAKGFCIVFVVMLHATHGVEVGARAEGWLHPLVEFAKPFRMPDFFLISGLFLARVIDRDWRTYLDRKVVHFAYFYFLWLTIQFAFKAPGMAQKDGWDEALEDYLISFVDPFGVLWFVYLLPVFFVVTKLARRVPPLLLWLAAAALQVMAVDTGWGLIDKFTDRYVYFFSGYLFAPAVFAFASKVKRRPGAAMAGLALWAVVNGAFVFSGLAELPFVSLALGFAGAAAVVGLSVLMSSSNLYRPVRYCGQNSIVIYLAFFLPMAAVRTLLLETGVVADVGAMSVITTLAGVVGALVTYWLVRDTPLRFLFERPRQFSLDASQSVRSVAPARSNYASPAGSPK